MPVLVTCVRCLVGQMTLASCLLVMSSVGFYTGANLEKAVCEPGENLGLARQVSRGG